MVKSTMTSGRPVDQHGGVGDDVDVLGDLRDARQVNAGVVGVDGRDQLKIRVGDDRTHTWAPMRRPRANTPTRGRSWARWRSWGRRPAGAGVGARRGCRGRRLSGAASALGGGGGGDGAVPPGSVLVVVGAEGAASASWACSSAVRRAEALRASPFVPARLDGVVLGAEIRSIRSAALGLVVVVLLLALLGELLALLRDLFGRGLDPAEGSHCHPRDRRTSIAQQRRPPVPNRAAADRRPRSVKSAAEFGTLFRNEIPQEVPVTSTSSRVSHSVAGTIEPVVRELLGRQLPFALTGLGRQRGRCPRRTGHRRGPLPHGAAPAALGPR